MDKKPDVEAGALPPITGPDTWSPAEAADGDPDEETPPTSDGDGG